MKKLSILATSLLALAIGLRFLPQPQAFAQAVNHYVAATFHPSSTAAGLAVECTTAPSSPANGSIWCDAGDSNKLHGQSNGVDVTLGINGADTRGLLFTIGAPDGAALSAAATTTAYISDVPFACTIVGYVLSADAGTATVKFWKASDGTAIPTSSGSINTSGVSLSSGTRVRSSTLTDFTTTAVSAHDMLAMNITAVTTAKMVQGELLCTR